MEKVEKRSVVGEVVCALVGVVIGIVVSKLWYGDDYDNGYDDGLADGRGMFGMYGGTRGPRYKGNRKDGVGWDKYGTPDNPFDEDDAHLFEE